MRILQGLVFALGHRKDDNFGPLPEIEHRGANEVSDVLDHDDGAKSRLQLGKAARHHVGFKMTSCTGIDLHRRCACGTNAFAVIGGRLVAFDHIKLQLAFQIANRAFQQGGLARTG